ncbi:glycogen synthase [Candidatus Roizmanbacteria bacterium]|nr:glycogen synthase [Candidatus Roizmanbacteria bacterium]
MDSSNQNIRVLFAVWELEPFLTVGGLGEVARSLPSALKSQKIDIRVIIPHYKAVKSFRQRMKLIATMMVPYGKKRIPVTIHQIKFLNADIPVYLLGNSTYFNKPVLETFIIFAAAVVQAIRENHFSSWVPTIVHCNDNHCGLIPLLCKTYNLPLKTLLTIHNIYYQRLIPSLLAEKIGIPKNTLTISPWETKDEQLNMLAEGIIHANRVNTVSKTYLEEIQQEKYGRGLDDVIRKYKKKISAILNGIDYELKNPATNLHLALRYSPRQLDSDADPSLANPVIGKRENKLFLQSKLGLDSNANTTMIGFIGRMDSSQKGINIIHRMLTRYRFPNCQFVIMGQGENKWEEKFKTLAAFTPDSVAVICRYDDILASQIYAAADLMMIPSHYEPCCLVQMNAMRYGAIPIARNTGGLHDTVFDGNNGILFNDVTAQDLRKAIQRALKIKNTYPKLYATIVDNTMKTNFSWTKSAGEYIQLYKKILTK